MLGDGSGLPSGQPGLPPPPPPPQLLPQQPPPPPLDTMPHTSAVKRKRGDGDDMDDTIVASRIQELGLKPGPGNSAIWEFFEKYNVTNDNPLRCIGICKICRKMEDLAKVRARPPQTHTRLTLLPRHAFSCVTGMPRCRS